MVRVEMLSMSVPEHRAQLERIMNDIHVFKVSKLLDFEKIYSQKEGQFLVFLMYRTLEGQNPLLQPASRNVVLTNDEQPPDDVLPEFKNMGT